MLFSTGTWISKGVDMKTTLAWIGSLLLAGVATSYAAADYPLCPVASPALPPCETGGKPMPCPPECCDPSCDPCAQADPCQSSCNFLKKWFHHEPKVKECKAKEVKVKAPEALNSPVFPV